MSGIRSLLNAARTILPEVPKPARKLSLQMRLVWTGVALVLFLVMSHIQLYGIPRGLQDQLAATRIIFASNAGTLMELGIGPIVTAGLILQLLKGSEIIKLDFKKSEERALFTASTKLLTLVVAVAEAAAFTVGGRFGPNLPGNVALVIVLQLFAAMVVVVLLDELVQKGWGVGSGVSLFIAAGVAQSIVWSLFSPIPAGDGPLGVVLYSVGSAISGSLDKAFLRTGQLPNLLGLIMMVGVLLVIIYLEGVRIEVPITSTRYRGFSGVYPIKLLYVSVLPVILVQALIANLSFFGQFMWSRFKDSPYINWFVQYDPQNLGSGPIGGLLYYVTSPGGINRAISDPLHSLIHVAFITGFAVIFAKVWVDIGGLSPRQVAKSLLDSKVQVPGFRRAETSVELLLARHIPYVTIISGLIIGLLASGSDVLGIIGSGTGILLLISILLQYYQQFMREQLETVMPRLAGILGKA